jgi:hypothetical protein
MNVFIPIISGLTFAKKIKYVSNRNSATDEGRVDRKWV